MEMVCNLAKLADVADASEGRGGPRRRQSVRRARVSRTSSNASGEHPDTESREEDRDVVLGSGDTAILVSDLPRLDVGHSLLLS